MNKGLIIGKGWLGSRLEDHLVNEYQITTTKRNANSENCISIDFDNKNNQVLSPNDYDFIVITIPFGKRNSLDELDFRFSQLIQFVGNFNQQIILISSNGVYPENETVIDETTFTDTHLNQPYQFIEQKLKTIYPQLVVLRLGGLMGDDRYLSKYINLDANNLDQVVNHTHYKDVCRVIEFLIEQNITHEVYNVVAPEHPTKKEVLENQINKRLVESNVKKGKTISSKKIVNELNYQFMFPSPLYFK